MKNLKIMTGGGGGRRGEGEGGWENREAGEAFASQA